MWNHALELAFPQRCSGCGAPGRTICPACWAELQAPPQRVATRVDPGVPVWSLGPYSQVRQHLIIAMKEHNNRAARRVLGPVLAAAVEYLQARGELPHEVVVVPAPTTAKSRRRRGGDPVEDIARVGGLAVARVLEYRGVLADSAGLGAVARRRNIAGKVRVVGKWQEWQARRELPPVVVFDDVATTGATLEAATAVLVAHGLDVAGAITLANA